MPVSRLERELQVHLETFAWSQWGQMGMLTSPARTDEWVVDPEALLLLTLEVGREEPRLFDETLDWLLVNERLISLRRLRNLAVDDNDRALVEAAVGWLSQWRRKPPDQPSLETDPETEAVPLFLSERIPVERPDAAFLAHGFLKGWIEPSRRSGQPDLRLPVNLALRLRSLLGVGARAEVVRILLTVDAPAMSLQAIAMASGFAKRNVQEAAASLRAAGVVTSWNLGNEQRFELPRERWLQLLSLERLPVHRDWPQIFRALRVLLRWLRDPATGRLSEYMRASQGRALVEDIGGDLRFAGISPDPLMPVGEQYWSQFETWVHELSKSLTSSA